jgi:hypothetical protein
MSNADLLERRSVVARLLVERKDAVVVGGLGASTYDIAAAGDHDRNFYLWGAMGGAVMIGLGIALAQPKLPVVVITGDGEMLMGMGSLATVGLQQPISGPSRFRCRTSQAGRALPASRSTLRIWSACSPAVTAHISSRAFAARSDFVQSKFEFPLVHCSMNLDIC